MQTRHSKALCVVQGLNRGLTRACHTFHHQAPSSPSSCVCSVFVAVVVLVLICFMKQGFMYCLSYVAEDNLELLILLPSPPKCLN